MHQGPQPWQLKRHFDSVLVVPQKVIHVEFMHGQRLIVRHVFARHLREPSWLLHHWTPQGHRHARTREAFGGTHVWRRCADAFLMWIFGKHKNDTCILKMLTRCLRGQLIRITTCVVQPVLALCRCISFPCFISAKRPELDESFLDTAPVTSCVAAISALLRVTAQSRGSIHHHDSWHESKPRTKPGWRTRHGVRACPAHCHPTSAYRCHPHLKGLQEAENFHGSHVWVSPSDTLTLKNAVLLRECFRCLKISTVHMSACHRRTLKHWKILHFHGVSKNVKIPWFTCLDVTVRH